MSDKFLAWRCLPATSLDQVLSGEMRREVVKGKVDWPLYSVDALVRFRRDKRERILSVRNPVTAETVLVQAHDARGSGITAYVNMIKQDSWWGLKRKATGEYYEGELRSMNGSITYTDSNGYNLGVAWKWTEEGGYFVSLNDGGATQPEIRLVAQADGAAVGRFVEAGVVMTIGHDAAGYTFALMEQGEQQNWQVDAWRVPEDMALVENAMRGVDRAPWVYWMGLEQAARELWLV